jgi:hypothetical protein
MGLRLARRSFSIIRRYSRGLVPVPVVLGVIALAAAARRREHRRRCRASPGVKVFPRKTVAPTRRPSCHLAGTSAHRFVLFERHASALEETWHGFFGPRILRLQEMTRAEMDQVPAIAEFAARPRVSGMVWPAAGLFAAVVAAGIALRQSRRALQG